MKTAKFFPVLIAAMILSAFTTLNAKESPGGNPSRLSNPGIRYEVTIHLPEGVSICRYSLYLVRITDEKGRLVAPPQVFVPGKSKYVFNETISVPGNIRMASLFIPPYVDPSGCPVTLSADPDIEHGPFVKGMTYSFDLYPVICDGSGSYSNN